MSKLLSTIVVLVSFLFCDSQTKKDHVSGQAIVMLQGGEKIETLLASTTNFIRDDNQPLCAKIVLNQTLSKSMNIYLLEFDSTLNENSILEKLKSIKGVSLAQFNHYTEQRITNPNDALFGNQWALSNTGQIGGSIDADIDAPEAWDIATGGLTSLGDTIVVAVIDAGFQLTHSDISFWKNYNEIAGNGIDDDGNGYIDDLDGWNALNNSGAMTVIDPHGTHCAGTVGAKGNNSIGTTGINWNVKVMGVIGSTTLESQAVIAYSYVRDTRKLYDASNGTKGAFIVATNSSFGVNLGQPSAYPLWCAMYDSLGAYGILNVGATANQNWDIDVLGDIPTSCPSPYMISVTNTTTNDSKYSSAAYGDTTIDIGAPGTLIYSTIPTNAWAQNGWIGTSMASPHVAGTVGLMFAAACPQFITDYKLDPSTKAQTVKAYLLKGADSIAGLNGLVATKGRLNLNKALLNMQSYTGCANSIETNFPNALTKNEIKNIFPNPSAGNWIELFYTSSENNFNVVLKNLIGQTLKTQTRTNHKGINKHKFDFGNLEPGIYLIGIETERMQSNFVKVVKSE